MTTGVNPAIQLKGAVDVIESCTGLSRFDAYTGICYAALTYTLDALPQCPTLVLFGPMSTGKTTALTILNDICTPSPNSKLDCRMIEDPTYAVLRDAMDFNPIVIVQEADNIDERLILDRYERFPKRVNRQTGAKVLMPVNQELFGSLAVHKRVPFKDPAVSSRCVILNTVLKDYSRIKPYRKGTLANLPSIFSHLSQTFQASQIYNLPAGRSGYNWGVLDLASIALPYQEPGWNLYKDKRQKQDEELTRQGQDIEPSALIWGKIAAIAVVMNQDPSKPPILVSSGRIHLNTLRENLQQDGYEFNPWQLGILVRDIGFDLKRQGGQHWVYHGSLDNIIKIGKVLHVNDELMNWYTP